MSKPDTSGQWTTIAVQTNGSNEWSPLPNRMSVEDARRFATAGQIDMRTTKVGRTNEMQIRSKERGTY